MRAAVPGGKNSTRTYECKAHQHVVRRGEPLDEYVEKIMLGYLSDPETRQRLAVMLHRGERVNVDELHTRRAALSARLKTSPLCSPPVTSTATNYGAAQTNCAHY